MYVNGPRKSRLLLKLRPPPNPRLLLKLRLFHKLRPLLKLHLLPKLRPSNGAMGGVTAIAAVSAAGRSDQTCRS